MRRVVPLRALLALFILATGALATAAPGPAATDTLAPAVAESPAEPGASSAASVATVLVGPPPPHTLRPTAFEYSDGYYTRLKVHKYASFATLPIFAAQVVVGQKLYNGTGSDSTRSLHQGLVGATAALFAVNTVTGVWNAYEGRKDPSRSTKKTVHGILMLLADAGFVATGVLTPEHERISRTGVVGVERGGTSPSTHRTIALASMGVATVSYLMMLFH